MKTTLLFILLVVTLTLLIPGVCAEAVSVGIVAVGGGDPGTPPQDAAAYIADAQETIAEGNWTNALILTTRGLAYYPDNADLLCLQGYTYRKMGQYQKAVDTISVAISLDHRAARYANRGYAYLALGNYSAALADAGEGICRNATYPANYGVKALALHGLERDPDALAAIDTGLSLAPDNAHFWHVKGIILAAQGDCAGAASALDTSFALDPGYSLPWPKFPLTQQSIDALSDTCTPGSGSASPAPTSSPSGWITAAAALGAVMIFGMRK